MSDDESNIVTVQRTKSGQFLLTLPKSVALTLGLEKGSKVELEIDFEQRGILLRIVE